MQANLDEAKQSGEVLASELTNANELLKKTREELQIVSHELTFMTENQDALQRELIDVYKMAETIANDLKEEKNFVSSLSMELQALQNQIVKDKEARKSFETDLEEATKSLNEVNRNILKLSADLDIANAKILSLEDKKMVLYKTLTLRKNASKEARAKQLVEELASAKGEILKLRSQMNFSKVAVNDQQQQKDETEAKVTVSARKSSSRRKKGIKQ